MEEYFTIEDVLIFEQVIDKSRFIGVAIPVSEQLEVDAKIQWVRESYPNARHYVYAYRILDHHFEKASDDGEPQGTGGRPILDLLQHRKVWDVLIVVVRYFGGVLLGTGGLTRAYGGTARKALDQKPLVLLTPHRRYSLMIPYNLYETVLYQLRLRLWATSNEVFTENVSLWVDIPIDDIVIFEQWIEDYVGSQVDRTVICDIQKRPITISSIKD